MRRLLIGTTLVLTVVAASAIAIDVLFAGYRPQNLVTTDHCKKVWAHKGLGKSDYTYDLPSIQRAFDAGFGGVELDVYYEPESKVYYVTHDFSKPDARNIRLTQALDVAVEAEKRFWLDFINLKGMATGHAIEAATVLKRMLSQEGLLDRVFVESQSIFGLKRLAEAGIKTSYWINADERKSDAVFYGMLYREKAGVLIIGASAVSMDYEKFGDRIYATFSNLPMFLFTINEDSIKKYHGMDNIKIVLTDGPKYALMNCTN